MNKRILVALLALSFPTISHAVFDECIGVYVGRISVNSQMGVDKIVLLANPKNTSGSYWINFSGWDREAKQEALSIILAAKAAQHRVDIYTTAEDNCSIGSPGQTLKEVHIATNP